MSELSPSDTSTQADLGARVREIRKARNWKLQDLADRTGLAVSTISKMERGEISLTYDRFMRLAQGLGLDVGELFTPESEGFSRGSVSLTRSGVAPVHQTDTYVYEMLAAGVTGKHMVPMLGEIKAHEIKDFREYVTHSGEEFAYLISGVVDVCIKGRDPVRLNPGDSLYFDSALEHVYVSASSENAKVLVVCWKPG
jgi:transcriptional regulator with XRE-family HTH domain